MKYYVNRQRQANGDHEVHDDACRYLPNPENRLYLGIYPNCIGAVTEAKKTYPTANGCRTCSILCHTS